MGKIDLALLIGLAASIALSSFSGFASDCEELRREVVRLHIIANSDSTDDQAAKYKVRDQILAGFGDCIRHDTIELKGLSEETLRAVEDCAQKVLTEHGLTYNAHAEAVNMYFGTRIYEQTIVAAGHYDAVRVVLGEGSGKNWWCVMFPPMCLPAAKEDEKTQAVRDQMESVGNPEYIPKFAILELIEGLRDHLSE